MSGTRTMRDKVAAYFEAHRGEWINALTLQEIGGRCASRTRISECRTELGMEIINRLRRVSVYRPGDTEPTHCTISEYMLLPPKVCVRVATDGQASFL